MRVLKFIAVVAAAISILSGCGSDSPTSRLDAAWVHCSKARQTTGAIWDKQHGSLTMSVSSGQGDYAGYGFEAQTFRCLTDALDMSQSLQERIATVPARAPYGFPSGGTRTQSGIVYQWNRTEGGPASEGETTVHVLATAAPTS